MSGSSGLSGRYAKALHELATEKKIISKIVKDFESLKGILKSNAPKHVVTKNRGDLDKLVRACFDSLTLTAISDDATIVQLNAKKRFCEENEEPGAQILVLTVK